MISLSPPRCHHGADQSRSISARTRPSRTSPPAASPRAPSPRSPPPSHPTSVSTARTSPLETLPLLSAPPATPPSAAPPTTPPPVTLRLTTRPLARVISHRLPRATPVRRRHTSLLSTPQRAALTARTSPRASMMLAPETASRLRWPQSLEARTIPRGGLSCSSRRRTSRGRRLRSPRMAA